MEEIDTGVDAQPQPSDAENRSLSPEEFALQRAQELSGQKSGTVADEESTEDGQEDYGSEEEEDYGGSEDGSEDQHGSEEPDEESTDSELLQFIDSATTEQLQEFVNKSKSRLVARVHELTQRAKSAEEKLKEMENEKGESSSEVSVEDSSSSANQFSDVGDLDTLKERAKEVEALIEWADDHLFHAEGVRPDAVIAEANGRQFTKAEIRGILKKSKKAQESEIPQREKQIKQIGQLTQAQKENIENLRTQMPWMADENSDANQRFQAVMRNPEVQKLKEISPKLWAEFPVFAAHALNSIQQMQGKNGAPKGGKAPRPKPPSGPNTAAGAPRKTDSRAEAGLKRLEERVQKTKSIDDFISLRAAQLHNR